MRTAVLVHGAWHGAWCFDKVTAELRARGVPVVALDLPGHGDDTAPLGDLAHDATRVRQVIDGIDGDVVLLGHSYGGLVISETASAPATAARIAHLVYLCAFCLPAGVTYAEIPPPSTPGLLLPLVRVGEDGISTIDTSDPAAVHAAFYGDCDRAEADAAVARLCPQPIANIMQPVSGQPLAGTAATYVHCSQDRALPLETQRAFVQAASAVATDLRTVEWDASHSPFLSRPDLVADLLTELCCA